MYKKKKKFIALSLLVVLLCSTNLNVFAADVAVGENATSATVPSSFSASESIVGAGAIVHLPSTLDLTYIEEYDSFAYKGEIYCSGSITNSSTIRVTCPETLKYKGDNTDKEIDAYIKLSGKQYGLFSNSDLEANTEKELLIQVPVSTITTADDFRTNVAFNIDVTPIGMYDTVGTSLASSEYTTSNHLMGIQLHLNPTTEIASLRFSDTLINVNNKYVIYDKSVAANDNVKVIEMADSPNVKLYQAAFANNDVDLGVTKNVQTLNTSPEKITFNQAYLNTDNLVTWIEDFNNLSTLVIPNSITYNQLHTQLHRNDYGSSGLWVDLDYYNYILNDTGNPIGDALVFVKNVNNEKLFVYVPNIVYRGTKAEWKALSANGEDWVFGNAANIVTVHCTDGKLIYQ